MDNLRKLTATELGRRIGAGQVDPVELTEAYLDAIAASEFGTRIYARLTPERALSEAKAAAKRAKVGQRLSLLDGVPVSWKDLFDTAGTATEAGTLYMEGRVPSEDAAVLKHATALGLVCLGKTHMTEIAFSGLGLNPKTETPPCVNDHDAVAGGSSSGAATSVAFGLAAAAVGSDTGGSVRTPSVWNDLVGLKTTHGLLSLDGVVPLCKTFDTVGPLCRTVEDAAAMLHALGGPQADLNGAQLRGARFAVLDTIVLDDLDATVAGAFGAAVKSLEAAGATVERISFPRLTEAYDMAGILYTSDAYSYWGKTIEAAPEKMYHQILKRIRPGGDFLAADYIAAWERLSEIRKAYHATMAGYDAVIMPTVPMLPPNAKRLKEDSDYFVSENLRALRNTRVANLMGGCALTIPTGVPSTGVMLNLPPMQEGKLLRLGAAVQMALG